MKELPKIQDGLPYDSFMKLFKLMKERHWLEDESKATYELWDLCDSVEKQNLIDELLRRFEFVTSRELNRYCQQIADHITQSWNLTNRGTKIVAISEGKHADGSQFIIEVIKNKFVNKDNWTEKNFINSLQTIGEAAHQLRKNQNIILIDDFIGTGKTMIRKVNWLQNKIREKNKKNIVLYIVSLAIMKNTIAEIKKLGHYFYAPLTLDKGISEHYPDTKVKIESMLELEQNLANRHNGKSLPSLGYGKSESLFAIEAVNIPNNVFPIFWWPVLKDFSTRKTIFKRIR